MKRIQLFLVAVMLCATVCACKSVPAQSDDAPQSGGDKVGGG